MPAVGGDHIRVEIADHGRAAELAGQPVTEGAEDRAVLPARARARRPGGDPLRLAEQVALLEPGRMAAGRGIGAVADAAASALVDELAVDELELRAGLDGGERELRLAHRERLFPKPPSRVTLNRASDGSAPRSHGVGEASRVRKTEFSDVSMNARTQSPKAKTATASPKRPPARE